MDMSTQGKYLGPGQYHTIALQDFSPPPPTPYRPEIGKEQVKIMLKYLYNHFLSGTKVLYSKKQKKDIILCLIVIFDRENNLNFLEGISLIKKQITVNLS